MSKTKGKQPKRRYIPSKSHQTPKNSHRSNPQPNTPCLPPSLLSNPSGGRSQRFAGRTNRASQTSTCISPLAPGTKARWVRSPSPPLLSPLTRRVDQGLPQKQENVITLWKYHVPKLADRIAAATDLSPAKETSSQHRAVALVQIGHEGDVMDMEFDGDMLLTASSRGFLNIYKVRQVRVIAIGRGGVIRSGSR